MIDDGQVRIAEALKLIAHQLCLLGHAGAVNANGLEIGAVEGLSMAIKEGCSDIAGGLHAVAEALLDK